MNIGEANDVVTVLRAYRRQSVVPGTDRGALDRAALRLIERAAKALDVGPGALAQTIGTPPEPVVYPVNNDGLAFYDGRTAACDPPFTSPTHGMCGGCTGCSCHLRIDHPHTSRYAHAVIEATL